MYTPVYLGRHEAYYKSTCDQTVIDPVTEAHFPFVKDELVRVEISNKVRLSVIVLYITGLMVIRVFGARCIHAFH